MPNISVIIPSYNHAPYVLHAIRSVLRQTVSPTEIIIVDDASCDNTLEILGELDDPRVKLVVQSTNQGGSESLNVGIRIASGDYIAICNSDDLWESDKLERQIRILEDCPELAAVFTNVTWVDRFGEPTQGFGSVFEVKNRSRQEWVRHLFENGNCLCHPSVLIRRESYNRVGEYDNRLRQLPDYKMWLNVASHYDFHVMSDKLVRFRVHANTSAPSPASATRDRNEFALIAEDFMRRIDVETFCRAFGSTLHPTDPRFSLEVEKVIYLYSLESAIYKNVASRIAFSLLSSPAGEQCWRDYGFTMHDFHTIHGFWTVWLRGKHRESFSKDETELWARIVGQHTNADALLHAADNGSATYGRQRKLKREILRIKGQIARLFKSRDVTPDTLSGFD